MIVEDVSEEWKTWVDKFFSSLPENVTPAEAVIAAYILLKKYNIPFDLAWEGMLKAHQKDFITYYEGCFFNELGERDYGNRKMG